MNEEESVVDTSTYFLTMLDDTEGDSSVMVDVVQDVLGEYQRQTYTVVEVDSEGNVIGTSTEYVPGLAGLDYHWIAGALLFALFITGIFKLLGGLFRQ